MTKPPFVVDEEALSAPQQANLELARAVVVQVLLSLGHELDAEALGSTNWRQAARAPHVALVFDVARALDRRLTP
jgi:Flp pilus assembly protein CpaB